MAESFRDTVLVVAGAKDTPRPRIHKASVRRNWRGGGEQAHTPMLVGFGQKLVFADLFCGTVLTVSRAIDTLRTCIHKVG